MPNFSSYKYMYQWKLKQKPLLGTPWDTLQTIAYLNVHPLNKARLSGTTQISCIWIGMQDQIFAVLDSLASHPPDLLRPKMVGRLLKKKTNLFTNQTLSSKSRVKCFRIYSNERFSCTFHFLLQAFFHGVCFSLSDDHLKCSSHFLKVCAEDPQHNFFCMMYFFADNFLLLDKYHKSSKCYKSA